MSHIRSWTRSPRAPRRRAARPSGSTSPPRTAPRRCTAGSWSPRTTAASPTSSSTGPRVRHVSFDIFVRAFADGDAADRDGLPVRRMLLEAGGFRVEADGSVNVAGDGRAAEVYGLP